MSPPRPNQIHGNAFDKDEASPLIISPAHFLVIASFPFCLGAYGGYRREVKRSVGGGDHVPGRGNVGAIAESLLSPAFKGAASKEAASNLGVPSASTAARSAAEVVAGSTVNPVGPLMAARALAVGTMLSIGGVGMISAGETLFLSLQ
mmetsp:Transcript_20801/g.60545  ORF Transcript_20801/g.60545 Transcript_20801/m.60545 type:complete len:148 (+) Transcript_20801:147-590(+)